VHTTALGMGQRGFVGGAATSRTRGGRSGTDARVSTSVRHDSDFQSFASFSFVGLFSYFRQALVFSLAAVFLDMQPN
jgi:hypothetical protein